MLQKSDLSYMPYLGIFIDGINFKFAYVLSQFYQVWTKRYINDVYLVL